MGNGSGESAAGDAAERLDKQAIQRPQGSRLIGQYDSQVSFGQKRVLLVWNRIMLPDGKSIVLERQHASNLPPMTVMSLTASVVGSIYKEIANEHRRADLCPCGWQPNPSADIEALQAALAATTKTTTLPDLHLVQVAGRA